MLLSEFEQKLEGLVVLGVYGFDVEAGASSSKILPPKPVRARRITTPLPHSAKKVEKGKHKEDMSDIDSCEDLGDDKLPSDLEGDGPPAVDTDSDKQSFDDSGGSVTSSDESSDSESQPQGPASGGPGAASGDGGLAPGPAFGGPGGGPSSGGLASGGHHGASGPQIWTNGYFYEGSRT